MRANSSKGVNRRPERFTVQDCTFRLGVAATTLAVNYPTWDAYRPDLEEHLPFNSRETRRRYASSLHTWLFEGGNLDSLAVQVWKAYENEDLLRQVLRERYLAAYPVLGFFVTSVIATTAPGQPLKRQSFEDFLKAEHASHANKTAKKLRSTMRDLGFLRSMHWNPPVVEATTLPGTAFLLLLHFYFAPQPATVPVNEVLAHPFWRYLGGREEAEVRSALNLGAAKDLLARYSVVDHLEQLTTRFSLSELLNRQGRL